MSKRKREGRNKGERTDKEECHLLCALFCLSLFSIHLSSILFFALPIKYAILGISPLSFSLPATDVPLGRFLHLQAKKGHRMRLKGTPMLDWQQAQLMLMILSLSLHMGDGTGVLFNRFLHLQEKKGHPTRRKSNIRDREGNRRTPHFT